MKNIKIISVLLLILFVAPTAYSKKSNNIKDLFSFKKKLDLFGISSTLLTDSEIRYSITVDENYKIVKDKPVIAYRFYYQSKNYRTLNWAERNQAYGIKAQKRNSDDSCVLYLDQYPNMKISIFIKDKKAYSIVRLDGKPYFLKSIKAKAEKGVLGIPEVDYVDIIAVDPKTKKVIKKRINN